MIIKVQTTTVTLYRITWILLSQTSTNQTIAECNKSFSCSLLQLTVCHAFITGKKIVAHPRLKPRTFRITRGHSTTELLSIPVLLKKNFSL